MILGIRREKSSGKIGVLVWGFLFLLCVAIWFKNDTIGKIELNPSFVLSSDNTNYKNDIQLFPQLFDELRVNGDYH